MVRGLHVPSPFQKEQCTWVKNKDSHGSQGSKWLRSWDDPGKGHCVPDTVLEPERWCLVLWQRNKAKRRSKALGRNPKSSCSKGGAKSCSGPGVGWASWGRLRADTRKGVPLASDMGVWALGLGFLPEAAFFRALFCLVPAFPEPSGLLAASTVV